MKLRYAFINSFITSSHLFRDPLLPEIPATEGLVCEDHITFVAHPRQAMEFDKIWRKNGYEALPPYKTKLFPATHTAYIVRGALPSGCERVVGLSTSDNKKSPITRCLDLYGNSRIDGHSELQPGRLQHIAYRVDLARDMTDVRRELESKGVEFMTRILEYRDNNGAFLKQMFAACIVPFGPFVEIVQRGLGTDGKSFEGFNEFQIDQLYEQYNAYSHSMLRC